MKVTLHVGAAYSNANRNKAGDAGVHMQSKEENDRHVRLLENEYIRQNKSRLPKIVGMAPAAKQARLIQQRKLESDAHDYAVKNEPKRFLPFLARKMNGIAGDKTLRRVNGVQAEPSSSWIRSISTTANGAPIIVETKSGKKYACPCPWGTAEDILKSKSVGAEVGARLFNHQFKIGKAGSKTQGKIVHRSNGKIAKIRGM